LIVWGSKEAQQPAIELKVSSPIDVSDGPAVGGTEHSVAISACCEERASPIVENQIVALILAIAVTHSAGQLSSLRRYARGYG
jgi:hypothetical protein